MPEYLSKEEVKKWRSSLEKITLEEYAARLGKVIEEEKHTNDLVDIVMHEQPTISRVESLAQSKTEKLDAIAQRAFDREKEITKSNIKPAAKKVVEDKIKVKENVAKVESNISVKPIEEKSLREEVRLVFKKALTDREQLVFEYFLKNKNKVVYAKDLAKLLDLPRDYVYKYIKNLRAKIEGENLQNADNGGYVLTV